jgi:hypothetical protein
MACIFRFKSKLSKKPAKKQVARVFCLALSVALEDEGSTFLQNLSSDLLITQHYNFIFTHMRPSD